MTSGLAAYLLLAAVCIPSHDGAHADLMASHTRHRAVTSPQRLPAAAQIRRGDLCTASRSGAGRRT